MKKNLFLVALVALVFACTDKPKKITGIVAEFQTYGWTGTHCTFGPTITFSDGRVWCLENIPINTLEMGSEIAIWCNDEKVSPIFNDSITVITPAPVTSKIEKEDLFPDVIGLPLSLEEFKILANFVSTKGAKVNKADCQYVCKDNLGNRHALISIRRTNDFADPSAPVSQISVWVNGKSVCEDKIFYSYIIMPQGVMWWNDADPKAIKETINKLLAMGRK